MIMKIGKYVAIFNIFLAIGTLFVILVIVLIDVFRTVGDAVTRDEDGSIKELGIERSDSSSSNTVATIVVQCLSCSRKF